MRHESAGFLPNENTRVDFSTLPSAPLLSDDNPPWRPITSMQLSRLWGVSLQSLANWRMRGYGPPFEPKFLGLGNKVFYRPDRLAAWLSNGNIEPWEVNLQWLARRDILVNPANRAAVEWIVAALELQLDGSPWPAS